MPSLTLGNLGLEIVNVISRVSGHNAQNLEGHDLILISIATKHDSTSFAGISSMLPMSQNRCTSRHSTSTVSSLTLCASTSVFGSLCTPSILIAHHRRLLLGINASVFAVFMCPMCFPMTGLSSVVPLKLKSCPKSVGDSESRAVLVIFCSVQNAECQHGC